jgi:hypothetical protein
MHVGLSRSRRIFGIICVALILMSGVVQAAHTHATAQADHDCALCVAAHSVAQAAAPVILAVTSLAVAPVTGARSITRPRRAVYFRLACRPPPEPFLTA